VVEPLFGDVGPGGSELTDSLASAMAKEIDMLERLNKLSPNEQRQREGADNSDLRDVAANMLGVNADDRRQELDELTTMAISQRVGDTHQLQGWLADQLGSMGKVMDDFSSGSRLTDLLMFLRKVNAVIQDAQNRR